ncbi:MAG: helix-turn-helix domain-containing protein [Candidatus Gastranaerophilales bacterium]
MKNNKIKTFDEHMEEVLQDEEYLKMYLSASIGDFIETGDYEVFFATLERAVRSKNSINNFSKKTGITRKALYEIFRGERVPRFDTVGKILKELGYTLNIA